MDNKKQGDTTPSLGSQCGYNCPLIEQDRRSHPRLYSPLCASICYPATPSPTIITDLSVSGCRLVTSAELPLQSTVHLAVELGEEKIPLECSVKWSKDIVGCRNKQYGLKFEQLPDQSSFDKLVHYVTHHLRRTQLGLRDGLALSQSTTPSYQGEKLWSQFRNLTLPAIERLRAFGEISRLINKSHDLNGVLEDLLEVVLKIVPAERGMVILNRGGFPELKVIQGNGPDNEITPTPYSRSILKKVLSTGSPVLSLDVEDDPTLPPDSSLRLKGTKSVLCVPIASSREIIGAIYLDCHVCHNCMNQNDVAFVQILADLACPALERARYLNLLIQSEKMAAVGTLIAGVAHELNSPLTCILNIADLLDDSQQELAEMLRDQGQRCHDMVTRLLQLSRSEEVTLEAINAEEVITTTLSLLRPELTRRGIHITTRIDSTVPKILANRNSLIQVLLNLLTNAIYAVSQAHRSSQTDRSEIKTKTSPPPQTTSGSRQLKPQIEIAVDSGCNSAIIKVMDNGPGIPEDKLLQIFDPFFTTKPRGVGTGLGLALTRTIVSNFGGTIEAHNRPEGGACFIICLPACPTTESDLSGA